MLPILTRTVRFAGAFAIFIGIGLFCSISAFSVAAAPSSLELPDQATVGLRLVSPVALSPAKPEHQGVIMTPSANRDASQTLPKHCVIVGDAQLNGSRVRVSTTAITCIETDQADSAIFTGEIDAAVYGSDGAYGLECQPSGCTLGTDTDFIMALDAPVQIQAQANPSAELNRQRREAEPRGGINPITGDRPTPD